MAQDTDQAWEEWAVQDPYYGVLTDPKFRTAVLTAEATVEFFESGRVHVAQIMDICRQRLDPNFSPHRVLDFGCGVGRLAIAFASVAPEVIGMDVSPTMLARALRHCEERAILNVRLVKSDDELGAAEGHFDLVHSAIVLQHIEISRGRRLFQQLVRRVRPGGCGAIHITFAWDVYAETFGQIPPPAPPQKDSVPAAARMLFKKLRQPFRRTLPPPMPPPDADPEMQMNFYNLSELLFILFGEGVCRLHTELTDHGGALGAFLYFQKPAPSR